MPIPPGAIDTANALAASQFVALVLALVMLTTLLWLYVRALNSSERAWKQVSELTQSLQENNTLVERLVEERVGRRGARS